MASLAERLKARTAEDTRRIEEHRRLVGEKLESELGELAAGSRRHVAAELSSIAAITETEAAQVREAVGLEMKRSQRWLAAAVARAWQRPVLAALAALLGILGAGWLAAWRMEVRVERLVWTRAQLEIEIAQQQRTLEGLEGRTWGVRLEELEDGSRMVLLPRGSVDRSGREVGGGWIRLSRR